MVTDDSAKKMHRLRMRASVLTMITLVLGIIVGWIWGTQGSEAAIGFANWVQILSGAFFLWAVLMVLGWEIQTWGGLSQAEKWERRLLEWSNSLGMFLLFSSSFAILFHAKPAPLEAQVASDADVNGSPTRRVLDASKFVLRDEDGKVRATLGIEQHEPTLTFQDANGNDRIVIADLPGAGPAIALGSYLKGTGPSLVFGVTAASAVIEFRDQQGVKRASIESDSDGPAIKLLDNNGKERATIGRTNVESKEDGTVTMRPESSLVLFDRDGNVVWKTPP